MTTGLGPAGANTALDAFTAAYPWMKLHVGDPGAAGTSNPATNTTRQQATFSAAASGATTNTNALVWDLVVASEDYTHFTLWSASTAGTFGGSGTLVADPITAGDTFQVAAGDLDLSFTLAS